MFWGVAIGAQLVVWIMAVTGASRDLLIATATTAAALMLAAGVWQIRCYVARVCALLRAKSEVPTAAELYAITGDIR